MLGRVNFKILIFTLVAVLAVAGTSYAAVDPMFIGVGARPLGMAKAYVAVAEDGDTIFINPAGLGKINSAKLTSMYTNLLNDAQYVVLGGAYPTESLGAFGGGAVSTSVTDIRLYSDSFIPDGTGSYGNHVFFLSYGVALEKLNLPLISDYDDDIYIGTNIKYFMQVGTGNASIEAGNGTGFDLDLGLLYTPYDWLSFGLCAQNILPAELGGKVVFNSGLEEGVASNIKIGTKVGVLGSGLYELGGHKLDVALDVDMSPVRKTPGATYLGLEYVPYLDFGYVEPDMLTLRMGVNSVPGPYDAPMNITAGIGFRYDGIEFNYAYHPFDNIPDNASHFFSISLVGREEAPRREFDLEVTSPIDKTFVYDSNVEVEGSILEYKEGMSVEANGKDMPLNAVGNFAGNVTLRKYGKNLVKVTANDDRKEKVFRGRLVRLISFNDVVNDYWARKPIEYSATIGLVEGYPDGTFKPERALSRAELATLLVRARGLELPERITERVFPDIPTTHWASKYIKVAVEMGLVKGYPDGTFRPNNKINRAEGVLVLARFEGLPEDVELEVAPYIDVPVNHWAAKLVSGAKLAGFLDYITGESFDPKKPLPRAEAIEILAKTTFAKKKIDWLLDWEVGFEEEVEEERVEVELKTFKDVPDGYWAATPIQALATLGIISGYPDGTFRPENTLTRAELSTLLVKARGLRPAQVNTALFRDLPAKHWASGYVSNAMDLGLVQGYPDGTFQPSRKVSRAEAVTVISRFDELTVPVQADQAPFPDVLENHWSAKYVLAAKEVGILDYLSGKNFEPNRGLTRAEAAEMLAKTQFGKERIKDELGENVIVYEPASDEDMIRYSRRGKSYRHYVDLPQ